MNNNIKNIEWNLYINLNHLILKNNIWLDNYNDFLFKNLKVLENLLYRFNDSYIKDIWNNINDKVYFSLDIYNKETNIKIVNISIFYDKSTYQIYFPNDNILQFEMTIFNHKNLSKYETDIIKNFMSKIEWYDCHEDKNKQILINKQNDIKDIIISNWWEFYIPEKLENKKYWLDRIIWFKNLKQKLNDIIIYPYKNISKMKVFQNILWNNINLSLKWILLTWDSWLWKTNTVRAISEELGYTLVYINIESILTMWYWETAKKLDTILSNVNKLDNIIIFIDEIDTFSANRKNTWNSDNMSDVRILSILLKYMDWLKEDKKHLLIWATNLEEKLDLALLNRFDYSIKFEYPNTEDVELIIKEYASHLSNSDIKTLSLELLKNENKISIREIISFLTIVLRESLKGYIEKEEVPNLDIYLQKLNEIKKKN